MLACVLTFCVSLACTHAQIPLEIRLLYESGNQVLNQSILRLFPDMRPNMSRGRVTVSFRIDDVSKNHQGQSFILEVAPEKQESSLMFQDIAPARTSVIAIRSKRNKRKLAGGVPGAAGGMRASPRSVAGTPRANLMMLHQPSAMASNLNNPMMMTAGPSPEVQRQRRVLHGTPTNNRTCLVDVCVLTSDLLINNVECAVLVAHVFVKL